MPLLLTIALPWWRCKATRYPVTADMLSAVNESQGYALGRGNDGSIYKYDAFGGVWVSDGNGSIVQIGDADGYINPE